MIILNKKYKETKLLDTWIESQISNNFVNIITKYKTSSINKTQFPYNSKKINIEKLIKYIIHLYIYKSTGKLKIQQYLIGNEITHFKLTQRSHTSILEKKENKKEIVNEYEYSKKKYNMHMLDLINITRKRILILKKKYNASKISFLNHSKLNVLKVVKNKKYLKKELFKKSFKKWHIFLNDFLLKNLILKFMLSGNKYKSYKRIYKILNKIKVMFGINPLNLIHSFFTKIKSIIEVNIVRYKKKIIYKPKFINYKKQIANVFNKMKELLLDTEFNKLYNIKMTYEEKFIYILIFFSLKKNSTLLTESEQLTTKLFFNKKYLLSIDKKVKKKLKKTNKKKKIKENINLLEKKIKKIVLKRNIFLEKEKKNSKKYSKYLKKYNNIKYIDYSTDIKYHNKRAIQKNISNIKQKKNRVSKKIDYLKKIKASLKKKRINKNLNKKIIKNKDPFNIYVTRAYSINDYNKNIKTKKNKRNFNYDRTNSVKKLNKVTKLFKRKKNISDFFKKSKKTGFVKKNIKSSTLKKKNILNINRSILTKNRNKLDLWYRYNNTNHKKNIILKNQLLVEKIITVNDYFSELKSMQVGVQKKYKTILFLSFKKKY
jgi:hypothetical protein